MAEKNNQMNIFKTVAEFSSDWLMWLLDGHTIQYISPAVKKITGYEPQEFIENANLFKQIIHPEDKERILEEFEKELQNPHSCSIQFRIIHKDGSVRWIAHRCRPVFDDNNKISGRVSSNRDVTSRKLAELALQEKEKFLASIIDGIQDPMHVIDRDYKVLLTNKKLLEMKNVKQEDIRGKYCYQAYQGLNEHCEQCAAKEVFETGKPHSLHKSLPLPDGTYRYFEVYAFPLFEENGDVMQVIEMTRDITNRERALREARKLAHIIEQSAEAVAITDTAGRIEYVNAAFERLTGYSKEEINTLNQKCLQNIDEAPPHLKEVAATLKRGEIWQGQNKMVNKNGENYCTDSIVFPIKDENGIILNFAKLSREITEQKKLETSLAEQQERLSALINAAPDIICFKDGQGRWLEANDADLKLFQLENVDYRGKKDSELAKYSAFYYDAFMTCEDSDEIAWKKGMLSRGIETIPKPDGNAKVYDIIKIPLFEEDGSRKGLVVLGRDITEMKQAQDALRESEEKYRQLVDASPDAIIVHSQGKIVFVNQSAVLLSGAKSEKELFGKNMIDFVHPDFRESVLARIRKAMAENRQTPLAEEKFLRLDGTAIDVEAVSTPILYSGKPAMQVIVRDITDRKRAEEALKNSEEKYRRIFEESQDVIFVSSTDGKFLDINPAGLRLFGYASFEEIQQIDIGSALYVNPQERERNMQTLLRQGFTKDLELRLKRKDGAELIALENSTAIYDANKNMVASRGIIRDITERKSLENQLQQAQKMESIGVLAGGVAHDFNNLLTVINGFSEMTLMHIGDVANPMYKNVLSILQAGKRAEKLTSQLLAFSRKQIYKPEIVNINQIIPSMDKMLSRIIGEDINIEKVLHENLSNVKADTTQLEQIFVNLVVNARDALNAVQKTDFRKKITIETGEAYLDKEYVVRYPEVLEGRYIFFSISDNGIGMDEQTKEKIFEPFFTTKAKYKGTGLGLSTVYGIVKQNKGSIFVYSEPGRGTMFKIYWPVTEKKRKTEQVTEPIELAFGNETILVVEDEEQLCRFASEALTSLGYRVYSAANGRLALELIKDKNLKMDIIVTDLIMPELNGKEFIKKVQDFYPGVKAIYVSGYTENHIVHDSILEDGLHFIQKPYSVKTLAAAVREVLDEK